MLHTWWPLGVQKARQPGSPVGKGRELEQESEGGRGMGKGRGGRSRGRDSRERERAREGVAGRDWEGGKRQGDGRG